jgi:hypothetical protein
MPSDKKDEGSHPYLNRRIVLTTKHHKLGLIAPVLEAELAVTLELHEADTDQLGTFSGEIERSLSPKETAAAKARMGMSALGLSLGIASEGSIGPDPLAPFFRSDIEHIVLVDTDLEIEIYESYRSMDIIAGEIVATPDSDLSSFIAKVDFPNHKLMVQPSITNHPRVVKGIDTLDDLERAVHELASQSSDGKVLLRSDLRAHCSPSRQKNIIEVARRLAKRIKALCPECKTPGWGVTRYARGLDCIECGELVTGAIKFEISGCVKCFYEHEGEQLAEFADQVSCDGCNP